MVQDQLQQKIVCPGVVTCLNASPDGLFLGAAVAETIYLWEVSRVLCVLKWVSSWKWPFSPQAHLNIISSDPWHVWNLEQQHQCPQRWSPGSRVGSGEWLQSFDWFRCPQVNCCQCSVATIRTSPAWSSQTTAAILFLEEKTTWLSCGTFRGRSHLSKCECTCPVGCYCTCVCVFQCDPAGFKPHAWAAACPVSPLSTNHRPALWHDGSTGQSCYGLLGPDCQGKMCVCHTGTQWESTNPASHFGNGIVYIVLSCIPVQRSKFTVQLQFFVNFEIFFPFYLFEDNFLVCSHLCLRWLKSCFPFILLCRQQQMCVSCVQVWELSSGELLLSVLFDVEIMSVTSDPCEYFLFCGGSDGNIFQLSLCSQVSRAITERVCVCVCAREVNFS